MVKTKEDRAKKVIELCHSGYCCSQSVALALCDDNQDLINRAASGFCGGMGVGAKCGAVTGMFIAAGVLYGGHEPGDADSKENFMKMITDLGKLFDDEFGYTDCENLKNIRDKYEKIAPQGFEGDPSKCSFYMKRAVQIFCDYTKNI